MAVIVSLLAGFLLSTSFAPWSLWWMAPISLFLLMKVLYRKPFRVRLLLVSAFGIAFFAPLLHWTSTYVGSTPWIILVFGEVALLTPIAFLSLNQAKQVLLLPAVWLVDEILRNRFPFGGFGWGRVGFSQADAPYVRLASLGGVSALSFFVLLLAVCLFFLFSHEKFFGTGAIVTASTCLVLIAFIPTIQGSGSISVVAIQGGVPQLGLDFNSRATAVFNNHLTLTRRYFESSKKQVDLVVWPENSVDVDPFANSYVKQSLQKLVDDIQVPIVIGAVLQGDKGPRNASILWLPTSGSSSMYIKNHLTPFGEYMPLRSIAEFFSPYASDVVDFIPGNVQTIHHVGPGKASPIICFDLVDDQLIRSIAMKGNLLLVQTNSATFGLSAQSEQELAMVRIRAVEHQRNAISISTVGVSAIIDSNGKIAQKTEINRAEVMQQEITLINSHSIADKLGNSAEILMILFMILAYLLLPLLKLRNRRMTQHPEWGI